MVGGFLYDVGPPEAVILSDRRESKDLRTNLTIAVTEVRRSFDALRLLRMTRTYGYAEYVRPSCHVDNSPDPPTTVHLFGG